MNYISKFFSILTEFEANSLSAVSKTILFILRLKLNRICGRIFGKYGGHEYILLYFVNGNREINSSLKQHLPLSNIFLIN